MLGKAPSRFLDARVLILVGRAHALRVVDDNGNIGPALALEPKFELRQQDRKRKQDEEHAQASQQQLVHASGGHTLTEVNDTHSKGQDHGEAAGQPGIGDRVPQVRRELQVPARALAGSRRRNAETRLDCGPHAFRQEAEEVARPGRVPKDRGQGDEQHRRDAGGHKRDGSTGCRRFLRQAQAGVMAETPGENDLNHDQEHHRQQHPARHDHSHAAQRTIAIRLHGNPAAMDDIAQVGDQLQLPAGIGALQLRLVRARQVALATLLRFRGRWHVHGEQILLRVLADGGAIDAAQVGVGPAQHAVLVAGLGARGLGAAVGGVHGCFKPGTSELRVLLERLADDRCLFTQPARDGKVQQLLHHGRKAGRNRPRRPIHVQGAGEEKDLAAITGPFDQGRVADRQRLVIAALHGGRARHACLRHEREQLARPAARRQLGTHILTEPRAQQAQPIALARERFQWRLVIRFFLGEEVKGAALGRLLQAHQAGREQPLTVAIENLVVGSEIDILAQADDHAAAAAQVCFQPARLRRTELAHAAKKDAVVGRQVTEGGIGKLRFAYRLRPRRHVARRRACSKRIQRVQQPFGRPVVHFSGRLAVDEHDRHADQDGPRIVQLQRVIVQAHLQGVLARGVELVREVDCILTRRNIDHGLAGKLEAEGRIAGDGAGAADIEFDAGAAARLGAIIVQRGRDRRRHPRGNERHRQREVRHGNIVNPFLADIDENRARAGLNLLQRFRRVAALPGGPGRALQVSEEVDLALLELRRGAAHDVLDGRERARQVGIAVR